MNQPLTRTISSQLTARLREQILTGAYAPGATLLQDAIAAEFGVSKIPVREALVQLQGEGLVSIFAHRGFQVRPLSASEFDEVFNLRLLIEPAAVAIGARSATDADRQAARQVLTKFNAALAANDLSQSGALNRDFHLALIVPALQPATTEVLGRLHILCQRYVRMHLLPPGRIKRAVREHTALYDAWSAGKAKLAGELTRGHIEAIRDDLAPGVSTTAENR